MKIRKVFILLLKKGLIKRNFYAANLKEIILVKTIGYKLKTEDDRVTISVSLEENDNLALIVTEKLCVLNLIFLL